MSMIGKTLGNFECTALLGKGGMGEVYKAKDQRLGRDVAIKVLPEEFAKDADRVARFQREAKLLASLNHPNIAAIHGLEESDGTHFLVLELIEGDTLADRLKHGAIPVKESLKLALQIAEALEAAHEKGVIHRDLKPANIKVTPEGKIKVLDFGLAKAFAGDQEAMDLSHSPTLSVTATQQGVIIGTAAYMSPEQAKGKSADKRADIWAFGVVLYEMLTGRSLFAGDNVSQILARVLEQPTDFSKLPSKLHPKIIEMLERCLEKEAKNRYGSISDARVDIQKVLADPKGVLAQHIPTGETRTKMQTILPWVAAALALGAIIAGLAVWRLKPSEPRQVTRFYYELPEGQRFGDLVERAFATSPDGSRLVYKTEEGLYLRSMAELNARLILGANENPQKPFFSPDGQWVGYVSGTDGKLKKVSVNGGASISIAGDNTQGFLSWNTDDMIAYATGPGRSVKRISANGGTPEVLVEAKEGGCTAPQILPDEKTVMFTVGGGPYKIMAQSLESGERKELIDGDTARYLPTGHIVYALDNNLFAVPFDLGRLEVTGGPVSMVEGVLRAGGAPQYAVSDAGTLAYIPGSISAQAQLEWYDRQGNRIGLVGGPASYGQFSLSYDEKRVAIERGSASGYDLWVLDLNRDGVGSPITFGISTDRDPVWSPDGHYILFSRNLNGSDGLYRKLLAGEEAPDLLLEPEGRPIAEDWSDDGRFIAYKGETDKGTGIYVMSLEDDQSSMQIVQGPFMYDEPKFSPDGKWLAYVSNESGQYEVYIKPLEGESERRIISTQGGGQPQWRGDGKELFYLALDGTMTAVELRGEALIPDEPKPLFQTGLFVAPGEDQYAVTRDGQRFLIPNTGEIGDSSSIVVVTNWFEELKERVPVD